MRGPVDRGPLFTSHSAPDPVPPLPAGPHPLPLKNLQRAFPHPCAYSHRVSELHRAAYEANRKLEERGEKLRQLNDTSSGLESEAAAFADMAKRMGKDTSNPLKFW
eukprot:194110-Chlamydomonas_euryale.AAC.1